MNTYKLQEEELLASFRPDTSQNRQQASPLPQQQAFPPQQQIQNYQQMQQNQSPPPPVAVQGQNIAFVSQESARGGGVVVDRGVPQRSNSPAIMISYNETQRGVSPHQGSIVTQVYKPIPQQPPQGIELKPQANIGQPTYVPLPPQQISPQQQLPPQQIVVQQQQIPQPPPIPQQQVPNSQNIAQIHQRPAQQGGQIAIPANHTVVYHSPQVVQHRVPLQQVVDQHGQVHYIQPGHHPHPQVQNHPYGQVPIGSQHPPPPAYHYPQQIVNQVPQQHLHQNYPHHRPYSEPAEQQQKQQIPHPQQIPQAQQIPQNHPQPTQPPQQIQNAQNAAPRVHTPSQHQQQQYAQYQGQYIQGQAQFVEGQSYPPQQYPPEYYQQGYYQEGQQGQYGEYPPEYYEQQGYGQYPPEYYQQQGYEQYPPEYYQQQEAQSTLWQQRFFYLYEKYQTFFGKYQGATKDASFLTQQFLTVDNEEDWVALKEKYDLLVEHMVQTRDENAQILQEMQENIQQNQKIESNQIKEEAGRVWEHRYHKLLQEYESLSHHYAELQSSSMAHNDIDDNQRIAMMNEKYARLQAQYNHVVQQLQESPNSMQSRQEHQDLLKYTQQLQGYIQQLQNENNTLMKGMKTSVEGSKMLDHAELSQKVADKESEIQNLTQMVVSLEEKLKQAGQVRPKSNISKDLHTSQLENQLQEMNHYCAEIQQKLTMKEYEINGLKDKIGYLEEQLHLKNQEIANNSKLLKDQLQRIQTEIATKSSQNIAPQSPATHSYARIEEDYQARIKDYQKAIQTKNGQIRVLEDRIYECEAESRKINFDKSAQLREWQERIDLLSEQFRKKLAEKDAKIKQLEATIAEREEEGQRRAQEKDQTVRAFEVELNKLKEETQGRLVERDLLIKGLKQAAVRLEGQLRDRNSQLSRMRSPNLTPMMRSPNQSFVVQNIRYEQELKLLSEQLQRRNEELGKLKKERQQRSKQYRDLEIEYQNLQQENNKRRIQINNLRRQNTTIQNLELEAENLRSTITKRNNQISELKNALFEADRLRMDLDNRGRELERLAQLSRMKAKEIEHLTQRNYELQQKLRKQEFKLSSLPTRSEPVVNRGAQEEILRLQQELRKKQIDINRYRLQSQENSRSLKRDREELQSLKQKYPSRLRQLQQQLTEAKLKLSSLEKKSTLLQNKNRELEELIRSLRNSAAEEAQGEAARLKEYYSKFIERQEEELKQLKERTRTYELRIHEYQQEVDQLSAKIKEAEAFRGDHARKLKALSDKLQSKQQELRAFKLKQNSQLSILRKKEQRLAQAQAVAKSRQNQIRELQRRIQTQKSSYKSLKKQFDDYKHNALERMEVSTHKEMQNLNKQIADYESKVVFQAHNFDFKTKDKKANQIFERRVIYQLKQENEFLRRELQGKGVNISLEKMKINQMQQEALMKSKHLLRDDHSHAEELAFYKDKNKELQERVNSHIAVNKNLRERLEYLLQQGKYEESDKLKLRLIQLENKEKQYQQKLERVLDQNKNIKRQNNSLSLNTSQAQEYQLKLQDLNRKLAQMTLERNTFQQEITVIRVQRENLDGQCKELQKQLTKLTNQNGVLKSEIQRLKQSKSGNNDGKNGNSDQLQRQISQLTFDLTNKSEQLQRVTAQFDNLKHHIHQLQVELANTKQQLLSSSQSYIEIEHWKRTASEMQSEIAHLREEIEHLEQQCHYFKSQAGNASGRARPEAFYYIELLRSNAVEVESLASEVNLQNQRLALLVQRLGENSKRSLESCQYLHEILS